MSINIDLFIAAANNNNNNTTTVATKETTMADVMGSSNPVYQWITPGRVEGASVKGGLPRFQQDLLCRGTSKWWMDQDADTNERNRKALWAALLEGAERQSVAQDISDLIMTDSGGAGDLACTLDRTRGVSATQLGQEESVELSDTDHEDARFLYKEAMATQDKEMRANLMMARKAILEIKVEAERELDKKIDVDRGFEMTEEDIFEMKMRGSAMHEGFETVEKIKAMAGDLSRDQLIKWNERVKELRFGKKEDWCEYVHMTRNANGMYKKEIKNTIRKEHKENLMPYAMYIAAKMILEMYLMKRSDGKHAARAAKAFADLKQKWVTCLTKEEMEKKIGKKLGDDFVPETPEQRYNRYRTEQDELNGETKNQRGAASGTYGISADRMVRAIEFKDFLNRFASKNKVDSHTAFKMITKQQGEGYPMIKEEVVEVEVQELLPALSRGRDIVSFDSDTGCVMFDMSRREAISLMWRTERTEEGEGTTMKDMGLGDELAAQNTRAVMLENLELTEMRDIWNALKKEGFTKVTIS